MKDLVVIIGTIILGAVIFNMMAGSEDNSLKNISYDIMTETVNAFEQEDVQP